MLWLWRRRRRDSVYLWLLVAAAVFIYGTYHLRTADDEGLASTVKHAPHVRDPARKRDDHAFQAAPPLGGIPAANVHASPSNANSNSPSPPSSAWSHNREQRQSSGRTLNLFLVPTDHHDFGRLPQWEKDAFASVSQLSQCAFADMDVRLTVVAPTSELQGTELTFTRKHIASAWKNKGAFDLVVPTPSDRGDKDLFPWAHVHPTNTRAADGSSGRDEDTHDPRSRSGGAHAQSNSNGAGSTNTTTAATVLLDIGEISGLTCAFADWAFVVSDELQGRRGVAGAALAPATMLQQHTQNIVPYSQPFMHMHPGAGAYVPVPHVWRSFLRWASRRPQQESLRALHQRLQTAAELLGFLSSKTQQQEQQQQQQQQQQKEGVWGIFFPQVASAWRQRGHRAPEGEEVTLPRSWAVWLAAYCLQEQLYSYYLPAQLHLMTLQQDAWHRSGAADARTRASQAFGLAAARQQQHKHFRSEPFQVSSPSSWKHSTLFPDAFHYLNWDNAVVPVCASSPCAHGRLCIDHDNGFVCCSPDDPACHQGRGSPALLVRVLAPCSHPGERLARTLAHLAAAEKALSSPHAANAAGADTQLYRNPPVYLEIVITTTPDDAEEDNDAADSSLSPLASSACRDVLQVADGWQWPYGRRTVQHMHTTHSISTSSVLEHSLATQSLVKQVWAAPHPHTPGGAPAHVLMVEAGFQPSHVYHVWLQSVLQQYPVASLPNLGGVVLLPTAAIASARARNDEVEGGDSSHRAGSEKTDAGAVSAVLAADVGRGALLLLSKHRPAFAEWIGDVASHRLLDTGRLRGGKDAQGRRLPAGTWQLFSAYAALFAQDNALFFLQPDGHALGSYVGAERSDVAGAASRVKLPPLFALPAVDEQGQVIPMCHNIECPAKTVCVDSLQGAVCMCESHDSCGLFEREDRREQPREQQQQQPPPGNVGARQQPPHQHGQQQQQQQQEHDEEEEEEEVQRAVARGPRLFSDEATVAAVVKSNARDGTIILLTTSSGFMDFFLNWRESARRVGITNYMVLAEDLSCYEQLEAIDPGKAVLSSVRIVKASDTDAQIGKDKTGFSYASKQYNEIVSRRPTYIGRLLRMGYNVLYTDTDTVWLENPFQHFPPDYDMYIQSDKEDETFDPWHMLCTGFMFMRAGTGMIQFMDDWRTALQEAQGKFVNQYIFNDLFQSRYRAKLRVYVLPDMKFPSGALFFNRAWREKQPSPPAVVHNNFIVGPDSKRRRFRARGLWFVDDTVQNGKDNDNGGRGTGGGGRAEFR